MKIRSGARIYWGEADEKGSRVMTDLGELDPRLDLWNHSPTGLTWGYNGSGPAQTALAILACHLDYDRKAVMLHQSFKFDVVGKFPEAGWTLIKAEIQAWLENPEVAKKISDWVDYDAMVEEDNIAGLAGDDAG